MSRTEFKVSFNETNLYISGLYYRDEILQSTKNTAFGYSLVLVPIRHTLILRWRVSSNPDERICGSQTRKQASIDRRKLVRKTGEILVIISMR